MIGVLYSRNTAHNPVQYDRIKHIKFDRLNQGKAGQWHQLYSICENYELTSKCLNRRSFK